MRYFIGTPEVTISPLCLVGGSSLCPEPLDLSPSRSCPFPCDLPPDPWTPPRRGLVRPLVTYPRTPGPLPVEVPSAPTWHIPGPLGAPHRLFPDFRVLLVLGWRETCVRENRVTFPIWPVHGCTYPVVTSPTIVPGTPTGFPRPNHLSTTYYLYIISSVSSVLYPPSSWAFRDLCSPSPFLPEVPVTVPRDYETFLSLLPDLQPEQRSLWLTFLTHPQSYKPRVYRPKAYMESLGRRIGTSK